MAAAERDKDVARFGRWAGSYNGSILQRLIFAPLQEVALEQAAALVQDPHAILEIGCGTGLLLRRAARRFPLAELTGIDPAEGMIRVARASVPQGAPVRFLHAFAEELPFPAASFDLVLTTMSFHHWADQEQALREVCRVLVPGGVFALADALAAGGLRWLIARSGHGRFNAPSILSGMLRDAGLNVEKMIPMARFGGTVQVVFSRAPD